MQLSFDLTFPTQLTFLSRVAQLAEISNDQKAYNFAMYLCELSLLKIKMLRFRPSLIATASVSLTCKMMKIAPSYTMLMKMHIGYS